VDWERSAGEEARLLTAFTAHLISLRRRYRSLRPAHYLHGGLVRDDIRDAEWFDQHGITMTPDAWGETEARTLTLRRAILLPDGTLELMLVLINADSAGQDFILPDPKARWTMLLDSAQPEPEVSEVGVGSVRVEAHSVVLLTALLP
jgi:glycogen operon protein